MHCATLIEKTAAKYRLGVETGHVCFGLVVNLRDPDGVQTNHAKRQLIANVGVHCLQFRQGDRFECCFEDNV